MLPIQIVMMAGIKPHAVSFPPYSTSTGNSPHGFARTATVTDGVGPFTYAWSWHTGGTGITLSNTTSATCSLNSSGTDVLREGELKCVVTDTGNGNIVAQDIESIAVQHGTPL